MKKRIIWALSFLCAVVQSIWAQSVTTVSTEQQLKDAITDGATDILLAEDIQLSKYLDIDGKTVTINLNGHKLSRSLSSHGSTGHVIWAHNGSDLTLTSSVSGGSIEGGKANNGGAIHIPHGNKVTATNVTFRNNSAADHAGAIWNNGTFKATNCTFENNTAKDVGAIYNSVTTDGAGTATLTGCTFTGNRGTAGAGALANALGNTVMTIDGCTITGNTADTYGAGIWNGGTLNMKGAITVTDNMNVGGVASNVYLKNDKVITVTGSLTGSRIGVDMESTSGTFTNGYSNYQHGNASIFTADRSSIVSVGQENNEYYLSVMNPGSVYYIERWWDDTNKKVVSTEKSVSELIAYDATPRERQYKEVTNAPASSPNEWFGMGGYSDNVAEYYVVRGNVNRETIVVQGKNVHLILCNGATLTLTGGLKLEGDNKLYIHSQSYGGDMGRLIVTNSYKNAAGIGSAHDNEVAKTVGELVIYGGHIEATGGDYGAGIGSCLGSGIRQLCNKVTVYGGYVKAKGGVNAAGIGGGHCVNGGDFILYDGTVIADGGRSPWSETLPGGSGQYGYIFNNYGGGAGVGGGGGTSKSPHCGYGGNVTVYGGTLTATGGLGAAGIGSAHIDKDKIDQPLCGGTFTIYGGTVTTTGGSSGAGIGGGFCSDGAKVNVYGGTVTATGGDGGSGIGGGQRADGGNMTITGGTVIAKAGNQGKNESRAIGSGTGSNDNGTLTIGDVMMVGAGNNGSVERIFNADERVNACWFRYYAEISPCTHPSGNTYTINGDGTHTSHCKHCTVSGKAAHFNSDGTGTCICGYKDGEGYCTITMATSSDGTSYEGVGMTANVGNNKPYTLPQCSTIPDYYDFAGWVVNPTSHNGIRPNEGETLLQADENIIVTGDVSIFARYKALEISLADDSDNGETLSKYNERKAASVTLVGRTLYQDGNWNTLCLPFSLTADQIAASPLAGADIRTLESASFADGTLTLNFTDAGSVTGITAGTPYIVKWAGGSHIKDPKFDDVTINYTYKTVDTDVVSFIGIYSPYRIGEEGDNTALYLGGDNKLYYPDGEMNINSFRAFFQLAGGYVCGDPNQGASGINNFVLNFGDDATGIKTVSQDDSYGSDAWYTIDGKKLNGMPTAKGIYIYKGRKVVK